MKFKPVSTAPNFGASSYKDRTGRLLRCFDMTKDGFTLLAMGFTGAKALEFKLKYIAAFNSLEQRLAERTSLPQLFCGSRAPSYTVISESGLYQLIMRSDKPEARKFQDWVTRDVLPAIRKTGGYLLNEEARETAKAYDRQSMPMFNKCNGLAVGVLV